MYFQLFKGTGLTMALEVYRLHCTNFNPRDVWFLSDNILFSSRKLLLGVCPECNKFVGELVETRISDGITFYDRMSDKRLKRVIKQERKNIIYSYAQNFRKKWKPFGWKYGVNKEISHNGKQIVKQYSCDFYNNKELQKIIY